MSHLRPAERAAHRHRRSDCRKGRHVYGETQNIGAGITRRVCDACAAVTIDITNAFELATPVLSSHGGISNLANRDS